MAPGDRFLGLMATVVAVCQMSGRLALMPSVFFAPQDHLKAGGFSDVPLHGLQTETLTALSPYRPSTGSLNQLRQQGSGPSPGADFFQLLDDMGDSSFVHSLMQGQRQDVVL